MTAPLKGVKVLDLSRLLPGPYCSMMLGDFGAEVIKVEQPGQGDYIRWTPPLVGDTGGLYLTVNRNKKSITLDLKKKEARDIIYKLVKESDVLLEGFRPGVTARLGIDYDTLKNVNPGLVYCSITGYGQDGPYALKAGHDINYIGYAGVLGLNGRAGDTPAIPPVQIADLVGGSLMAVNGILLALLARERTGQGQFVDIAMMDGVVACLPVLTGALMAGGRAPVRGGELLSGGYAFYNVYSAADGKYIALGALEGQFWERFCRHVGREDLIPLQFTIDRQEEIIAVLREIFIQKTRERWLEELEELDICCGPVNDLPEAFQDPQVKHREMVLEIDHPRLGKIMQLGLPVKLSKTPGGIYSPPPELGEHTDEVLAGLGYTAEDIALLREKMVV
ncbi:alpha-methylacyl-CoA racemase [Desulfocucumis palustris]|uniref:Alpha-methylacyl-CoA racemase n=1 Tax=Desulfocucumis palustris TaxID=1898651 RepID=A0A2L2X6S2_9FIRM|nr:CaiB/BaiF CoA-transferase family protein [Desulfocucumis palustris]GBF31857.1 alpha-methylacyl-CoA racemase [Desulfocucumis palustris]